jgi:hypothetical protein
LRREIAQRTRKNIRKHQIVRCPLPQRRVRGAFCHDWTHEACDTVTFCVDAGCLHANRIDIPGANFALEQFGCCDGKDAGAGAEIEDGAGPPLARDEIQHVEAAARRTMVAGAKGKCCLDLDCNVIGLDRVASMRAMNEEASRPHRSQPFEGSGHPVALIDAAEACRAGSGGARNNGDKSANVCFVRRTAKIGLDDPTSFFRADRVGRLLEGCGGGRGRIKSLDNNGGDPARRRLVASETHDMRGAIWGQAFEHGGRYHAGQRTAIGSLPATATIAAGFIGIEN